MCIRDSNTTERPEALEAGTAKLVGTNYDRIVNEVSALLDNRDYYDPVSYTHLSVVTQVDKRKN